MQQQTNSGILGSMHNSIPVIRRLAGPKLTASGSIGAVCALVLSLALAACASPGGIGRNDATARALSSDEVLLSDESNCRTELGRTPAADVRRISLTRMHLLNWNTHKNSDAAMQADINKLASGADLLLLQEAVSDSKAFRDISDQFHWSFAPGFKRASLSTGVMTASRVRPLATCSLTNYEPWLKSPKATNITKFALQGTDKTLLVLNLHLINFTIGLDDVERQLNQALNFVAEHDGPVIVSGDFNTWRKGRRDLVENALTRQGLVPVAYDTDYRKRVFGYALDHTFVRDIKLAHGTSHAVQSSDHNPTSITLEF